MCDFEEIEHTADWALRIRGRDLAELLVHAAQGLNSLLTSDLAQVPLDMEKRVVIEADDAESLLVQWLSELAYWAEAERLIFREFDLRRVTATGLEATIHGGRATSLQKHIKAVTYHELAIVPTAAGLEVTVVFDV